MWHQRCAKAADDFESEEADEATVGNTTASVPTPMPKECSELREKLVRHGTTKLLTIFRPTHANHNIILPRKNNRPNSFLYSHLLPLPFKYEEKTLALDVLNKDRIHDPDHPEADGKELDKHQNKRFRHAEMKVGKYTSLLVTPDGLKN